MHRESICPCCCLSNRYSICISITFVLFGQTQELITLSAIELSVWISVCGWGYPISCNICCMCMASLAYMNNALISASAAANITVLTSLCGLPRVSFLPCCLRWAFSKCSVHTNSFFRGRRWMIFCQLISGQESVQDTNISRGVSSSSKAPLVPLHLIHCFDGQETEKNVNLNQTGGRGS